jgi:hypothetical protein
MGSAGVHSPSFNASSDGDPQWHRNRSTRRDEVGVDHGENVASAAGRSLVKTYASSVAARVRIIGTSLPGTSCGPAPTTSGSYRNIHVGVQNGDTVVDLVRGDAAEARFEFEVSVRGERFGGRFVHGRAGERFIYLSWGELTDGSFTMFRRAKLQLDSLDAAACDGHLIEGRLVLSDEHGWPICASVRPPRITWTIE